MKVRHMAFVKRMAGFYALTATAIYIAFASSLKDEVAWGLIASITTEYDHSVVAIVGEGMAFRPGTGATFTQAMATAGINIRTIA